MGIDITETGGQPRRRLRTAADRASSNPGGRASFVEPTLLAALALRPGHGYSLRRTVEEMTEGLVAVDLPGTYRMLRRFEAEGLAESTWAPGDSGPQRREYALTSTGRALLVDWREFLTRQRRVCNLTTGAIDAALSLETPAGGSADPLAIEPSDSGGGA